MYNTRITAFLKISFCYQKFPLHPIFLSEFSFKLFAFWKFTNFCIFHKVFKGISPRKFCNFWSNGNQERWRYEFIWRHSFVRFGSIRWLVGCFILHIIHLAGVTQSQAFFRALDRGCGWKPVTWRHEGHVGMKFLNLSLRFSYAKICHCQGTKIWFSHHTKHTTSRWPNLAVLWHFS